MKSKNIQHFHVVDDEIQEINNPHPFDNTRDKKIFMDLLLKDLNIKKYEIIGNNNNLVKIVHNDVTYNIFVEFPDGGGRLDSKKISIPFNNKTFCNLIFKKELILIINVYVPLKKDLTPNQNERIYLVVDPKEIYKSEVLEKKTRNPSSRWVKLETIHKVLMSKNTNCLPNKKNNVFVVKKEFLNSFLTRFRSNKNPNPYPNLWKEKNILLSRNSLDQILNEADEETIEEVKTYLSTINSRGSSQAKLRAKLFEIYNGKCLLSNIESEKILIASHIIPWSEGANYEGRDIRGDVANAFLLSASIDKLFDSFLISINPNNMELFVSDEFKTKHPNHKEILEKIGIDKEFLENNKTVFIPEDIRSRSIEYLKYHYSKTKDKK